MDERLQRVASAAKAKRGAERELVRADRALAAAVVAAHKRGASLRAIRDATGGLVSHEWVRRQLTAAAARKGGR